jgi:hypothetical protein
MSDPDGMRRTPALCLCALLAACAHLPSARESALPPLAGTAQPVTPGAPDTAAVDAGPAAIADEVGTPEPVIVPCIIPSTPAKKSTAKPKPKSAHPAPAPSRAAAPAAADNPTAGPVEARVRQLPVSVMSILGKRVEGPKGEDLGRVVDVLADDSGRVRVAIIDFGGFLGVGDRRIAIEWQLLHFVPNAKEPSLELGLTREQLQKAPEYKDNPRPQTLVELQPPASGAVDAKK